MRSPRRPGQSGFTLLELMAVIAVLGVLSGVTVLGVGSLRDRSQDAACRADAQVLDTAEAALFTSTGAYGSEAALVSSGYITSESQDHDIVLSGDDYSLIGVSDCTPGGAAETADPTTTTALSADDTAKLEKEKAENDRIEKEQAEKEQASTCKNGQININKAGTDELQKIVNVGPKRAEQIVSLRPFSSVQDLERVSGLAAKTVADIQKQGIACV